MVDVVDLLDPVVLLQRHVVEAGVARRSGRSYGLRPARPSGGGVGADQLVVVEHGEAVEVLDRDDRVGEVAVGPGLGGPVVGLGGERVDVVAGPALEGGDQVGADALRHEAGRERGGRVGRPGAAVGAHRHPAHRLDAAGEDQVLEAAADPGRRLVDGLEAGGAEAVELHAGDGLGEPGRERGGLGDVAALVADRRDDAEHDVVDRGSGRGRGCASWISSSRPTTRSTGLTSWREPAALPLPRGVRMWSYTNASAMSPIVTPLLSRSRSWRCDMARMRHCAVAATGRHSEDGPTPRRCA